jgi:hypothetical protein
MTEVTINKVKKIHRMQDNICKWHNWSDSNIKNKNSSSTIKWYLTQFKNG